MIKEILINANETSSFASKSEIFRKYFPSAQVEIINVDNVPPIAVDFFEYCSKKLIDPEDYKVGNFNAYFLVRHNYSGEVTYAAQQLKKYSDNETEILIELIDLDQSGNKQGNGEIRYDPNKNSPYFIEKPFTGYIETEEGYREKGLGRRRILMMNAFSQMIYGLPIHSDTLLSTKAKSIFEKLLSENMVSKYKEGGRDRYAFKK